MNGGQYVVSQLNPVNAVCLGEIFQLRQTPLGGLRSIAVFGRVQTAEAAWLFVMPPAAPGKLGHQDRVGVWAQTVFFDLLKIIRKVGIRHRVHILCPADGVLPDAFFIVESNELFRHCAVGQAACRHFGAVLHQQAAQLPKALIGRAGKNAVDVRNGAADGGTGLRRAVGAAHDGDYLRVTLLQNFCQSKAGIVLVEHGGHTNDSGG